MRHFSVVCTLAYGDRLGAPRMISPASASIPAQRRIQPELKETNMRSATFRMICRVLIAPVMALSVQTARAGMIGADQVSLAAAAQTERNTVLNALGRPAVTDELQALGVDPQAARDRVAAMSDEELDAPAGQRAFFCLGSRWAAAHCWFRRRFHCATPGRRACRSGSSSARCRSSRRRIINAAPRRWRPRSSNRA